MRIQEFSILRYGILPPLHRVALEGNLVLVWGPNELGKTMLLEALLKMMLGTRKAVTSVFPYLDRVGEMPEGYVRVEGLGEKPVRFPGKKTLLQYLGITPEEFRNLFVVRDSDLQVVAEIGHGQDFYTRISERTERITGMKTSEIQALRKILLDLARLTPEGRYRDVQGEKLRSRLKEARELKKRLDEVLERAEVEGWETLEARYAECRFRLEERRTQKNLLLRARTWAHIRKAEEHLNRLEEVEKALSGLAHISEEDARRWREIRQDLVRIQEDLKTLREKLQDLEHREQSVQNDLTSLRVAYEQARDRAKALQETLSPLLQEVRTRERKVARQKIWDRFFRLWTAGSAALLALSLAAWILRDDPLVAWLTLIFLSSTLLGSMGVWRGFRIRADLEEIRRRLLQEVSRAGMTATSPEDVARALEHLREQEEALGRKESALAQSLQELARQRKEIQGDIERKEAQRKNRVQEEDALIQKVGVNTLAAYEEMLRAKRNLEAERRAQLGALEGILGPVPSGQDPLSYYREVLARRKREAGEPLDMPFREEELRVVEEEIGKLEEEMESLERAMERLREDLQAFGRKANKILLPPHPYPSETLDQIREIRARLLAFMEHHKTLKARVEGILEILREMEEEEREKVKALFGPASEVTRRFARITGGRYAEVLYDEEARDLRVRTASGDVLRPDQLSGGAVDQLYFVVRTVLGEALLQGKGGFFLLDDPFVKADPARLRALGGLLLDLIRRGWQILYFSSKGEIRDLFQRPPLAEHLQFVDLSAFGEGV